MKITPFATLEQHARAEYRKRFASAPEPKVRNARALATMDAPRCLVWGGVTYWVPPLSYEAGVRLMIAGGALRECMERRQPTVTHNAVQTTARLLRNVLDRKRRPLWRFWSRAFFHDTPEALGQLVAHILHVEDEAPVIPSERPFTVDLVDNLYAFQAHFGRRPESWRDYVYGMRHIGRASSRDDLRRAITSRVGVNAPEKSWAAFEREVRQHAGWN